MPKRRDTPCSACGQLLWRGGNSAPHPMCRPCRRTLHRCTGFGGEVRTTHNRCRTCRKTSATARGFDHRHQRARRAALRQWRPDQPCIWCGEATRAADELDYSRKDDTTVGLAHASCARRRGRPMETRRRTSVCHGCGVTFAGHRRYCTRRCYDDARTRV